MKLANTTLTTGADDSLAAVDAYALQSTSVVNSIVEGLSDFSLDALSNIRNDVDTFSRIDGAVSIFTDRRITQADAEARISALLDAKSVSISTLSKEAQKAAAGALKDTLPLAGDLKYVVNDVIDTVSGTRTLQARSLINSVSELVGDEAVARLFDLGAEGAIVGALLGEALRLEMPGVIDTLLDDASDASVVRAAVNKNLLQIATTGDVATLDSVVKRIGYAEAISQEPTLINVLLRNYRLPSGTVDYAQEYQVLTSFLTRLDANWATTTSTQLDSSLKPFSELSTHAQTLFTRPDAGSDYITEALMASSYPDQDFLTLASACFPQTAL